MRPICTLPSHESADEPPDKWSPALQIRTVLLSIQALLSAPNPDDPLATDVAKHYKQDERDAQRVSKEWTEKYGGYRSLAWNQGCLPFASVQWTDPKPPHSKMTDRILAAN